MPVVVTDILEFPEGQVWEIISDFGGLMRWHPQVLACALNGEGIGCERTVQLADRSAVERLDVLDVSQHIVQYTITSAADQRSVGVTGRIELAGVGPHRTRITWTSGLPEGHPEAEAVNSRLGAYYPTRIGHLKAALSAAGRDEDGGGVCR